MRRFLFTIVSLLISCYVFAQPPEDRWGISASWGPTFQVVKRGDKNFSRNFDNHGVVNPEVKLTRYLRSGVGVSAGYWNEEVRLLSGDVDYTMGGLLVGARYYATPSDWVVHFYGGADLLFNFKEKALRGWVESFGNSEKISSVVYSGKSPFLTVAPNVGVEIPVFSSILFFLQYDFRLGIRSSAHIIYRDEYAGKEFLFKNHAMRHSLVFGLRVNFPFEWNEDDSFNLVNGILDLILCR